MPQWKSRAGTKIAEGSGEAYGIYGRKVNKFAIYQEVAACLATVASRTMKDSKDAEDFRGSRHKGLGILRATVGQ